MAGLSALSSNVGVVKAMAASPATAPSIGAAVRHVVGVAYVLLLSSAPPSAGCGSSMGPLAVGVAEPMPSVAAPAPSSSAAHAVARAVGVTQPLSAASTASWSQAPAAATSAPLTTVVYSDTYRALVRPAEPPLVALAADVRPSDRLPRYDAQLVAVLGVEEGRRVPLGLCSTLRSSPLVAIPN